MGKKHAIVVSHTHWDREWYLSFQEYRVRLIRVIDKIIELLLQNPKFKCFMLDGQVCAIEDYLEIKPEKKEIIKNLILDGKLKIGPLYTQPDEALVSPEALVRNFLIGIRIAESLGGSTRIGYLPDTFGHTAQLPQILRGFEIDNFFFTRGLGDDEEKLTTEFIWRAPDGSSVLAVYLRRGYCNANMLGIENPYSANIWRAPEGWYTVFLDIYFNEPKPNLEEASKKVKDLMEFLIPKTPSKTLLLMNGCDHQPPQSSIVDVIDYLNSAIQELEIHHGSLEDYINRVKPYIFQLKVYQGELRGARSHPLLVNVLSSRAYLKKLNYRSQLLLEKYAEPLCVFAMLNGHEYPYRLIQSAWKILLQNHAHDSIYGSGSDNVHNENESRFLQVIGIASNITYEAARKIAEQHKHEKNHLSVMVFNASNWSRSDIVLVPLPLEIIENGAVAVDKQGNRLPIQLLEKEMFWSGIGLAAFVAKEVPPFGYRIYKLEKEESQIVKRDHDCVIENEYFKIEANPDKGGLLKIIEKETGCIYEGLNIFVDDGDAGDEYNYSPPKERNEIIESTEFKAEIEREVGPVMSRLRIMLQMEVPEKLVNQSRSSRKIKLPVLTEIFLYYGVKRIDIKTTVDNNAADHRFRVKFILDIPSEKTSADSHFYVIERSIKPESKGEDWVECPPTVHPQLYWISISDGKKGFTIANKGIPEYEASLENGKTVIYLTLFRSVGWLSRDDLQTRKGHAGPPIPTPGAQCMRKMVFEYSLIPHAGTWLSSKAYKEARNFAEPLMALALPGLSLSSKSFISVSPDSLVVTAVKKAEDNDMIVLRFYNITGKQIAGVVRLGFNVISAYLANLMEKPLKKLEIEENTINVNVKPYQIYTMLIKPKYLD